MLESNAECIPAQKISENHCKCKLLSIVVPAFNEAENIPVIHHRVRDVLGGKVLWELILVDDGSRDGTWQAIHDLAAREPGGKGIRVSKKRPATS